MARVLRCLRFLSAHTPTTNCALGAPCPLSSTDTDSNLRPWRSFSLSCFCLSPSVAFPLSLTNSLVLRPLLGRRILSPPIGGGHASFPRHRDRSFFTPVEFAAVFPFCTQPPKNLRPLLSVRCGVLAGNSCRIRSTARFARVDVATRCVFVGVGSCGGGGVVASLMDVVWRERGV